MSPEQFQQLKSMVAESEDLSEEAKAKLLQLVAEAEEDEAAPEGGEPADPMDKLVASVEQIEASHPDATAFMNRVATTLANMGI
jgi:hypothetical protein